MRQNNEVRMVFGSPYYHTPVMVRETLEALQVQVEGSYVDCTVGEGGHSLAIMECGGPGTQLLGIDADPGAVERAEKRLASYEKNVTLVNGNFGSIGSLVREYGLGSVKGILFDLGMSSRQIEMEGRGFSFQRDDPLDMRFDPSQGLNADEVVNKTTTIELTEVLRKYGEEPRAGMVARAIVRSRPIHSTLGLAHVVERAVGGRKGRVHPATRTFQALRVHVNNELGQLESALSQAIPLLELGGRLAVLSYHSLEDRLVKRAFQRAAAICVCSPKMPLCVCRHEPTVRLINRKAITPSLEEIHSNPRSRSVRLRTAERV